MRRIDPRLVLAITPFLAAPALADDLFIGSPLGAILQVDPAQGDFQFAGACGGPIRSMALAENTIMIGDTNGNMYGLDIDHGGVGYYFTIQGSDNTDIVVHGDTLLVSSLDGTIRRVNPDNGQLLNTYTSPIQVRAMVRDDQFLYVAGPDGAIYRAGLNQGVFSYFACVCLGPINSLAIDQNEIFAGDERGVIMRFDLDTGDVLGAVWIPGDNTAMTAVDGDLLVTDSEGNLRRVDPTTGEIAAAFDLEIPLEAMVLVGDPACPGDFDNNGTVDSTDFFEFVSAFLLVKVNADVNADGRITSDDLFAFLTAFFTPCI